MGRDAEHLQIVCLTSLFTVGVRVLYLDQSEGAGAAAEETIRTYVFPEGAEPRVNLLYRSTHDTTRHDMTTRANRVVREVTCSNDGCRLLIEMPDRCLFWQTRPLRYSRDQAIETHTNRSGIANALSS
jgi:hypothetical protein